MPTPANWDEPAVIQQRIRERRHRVTDARGPDAGHPRIAGAQRDRATLGALPAAVERQQVADHTTLARGDPEALTHLAARHSAQVASTIRAVRGRWPRARARLRNMLLATALGAVGGVLVTVAVHRHSTPPQRTAR